MSDKPELKPCPFCGEPGAEVTHGEEELPTGFWGCNACGVYRDSPEEWNQRPIQFTVTTGTVNRAPRFSPEETEALKVFVDWGLSVNNPRYTVAAAVIRKMLEEK